MSGICKFLAVFHITLFTVALGYAQGTLESVLSPYGESVPPLAAYAIIDAPATNSVDLVFPVSFQICVNTNNVVIDAGRIYGGSTAWAFSLGAPTIQDDSMTFSGVTEMEAFQINDMLADQTQLEILDGTGFTEDLVGPLVVVPEPSSLAFGSMAIFFFLFRLVKPTRY